MPGALCLSKPFLDYCGKVRSASDIRRQMLRFRGITRDKVYFLRGTVHGVVRLAHERIRASRPLAEAIRAHGADRTAWRNHARSRDSVTRHSARKRLYFAVTCGVSIHGWPHHR
jgi:hypothetical protein